jgi:RimJ/RimL family protein N-acetyltransferase
MLEGLLVDLVPYGERFLAGAPRWWNNESDFWGGAGRRRFVPRERVAALYREWRETPRAQSGVQFGIQTKDGRPIGDLGLNSVSIHNRTALLGANIGEPEYWGGGYGTDALLMVVDYAFDTLDLRRLWLVTMSLNARVVRQMAKVGFTLEGRRREAAHADGVWYDELVYGLLREEWPGREAMLQTLSLKPT